MKLKRGFNLLLSFGHLVMAAEQQPLPLDIFPDGSVTEDETSRKRGNHAQEIK